MNSALNHTGIDFSGIVVVVPTYNNDKTLTRVLEGILAYTDHIIIVNDGSTDRTHSILKNYPQLTILSHDTNKGKGVALQNGLRKAREMDYSYAITIDSDGQHYPDDLPIFVAALQQHSTPVLLIGSRNMTQDSVPKKSSFGNKFSNFWFWVETGIKLTDTQSGYRAYPVQVIPRKLYTPKFELEIELIVRSAWAGIPVQNVPVNVLYDPSERVSHFRPFRDFTRISILNTVLVFLTFIYIVPRNFLRSFKKKSFNQFVKQNILGSGDSAQKMAFSIGLGIFGGILPIWGFQTAFVITVAVFFRLNKVLAFTFSNVSLPPFIPFIIYLSLVIGRWVIPGTKDSLFIDVEQVNFSVIEEHLLQYLVGSVLLATFMAVIIGFMSYLFMKLKINKSVST